MNPRAEGHPWELLSALVDGEVDAADRLLIEVHLRECESCRKLLDDLWTVASAASRDEVPPVPSDLEARIAWRLRSAGAAGRRKAPRGRRFLLPATAVATLAAATFLVALWVRSPELRRAPSVETDKALDVLPGAPPPPPPDASLAPTPALEAPAAALGKSDAAPAPRARKRSEPERRVETVSPPLAAAGAKGAIEERTVTVDRVRNEAPARQSVEGGVEGGVPGGVVGGVVGGVMAPSAPAESGAGETASRKREETRVSARPAAATAKGKDLPVCESTWSPGNAAIVRWPPERAAGAGDALSTIARRRGGRALPILRDGEAAFVVRVPSSGWAELLSELRGAGVTGLDRLPSPPAEADCAELTVAAAPDAAAPR